MFRKYYHPSLCIRLISFTMITICLSKFISLYWSHFPWCSSQYIPLLCTSVHLIILIILDKYIRTSYLFTLSIYWFDARKCVSMFVCHLFNSLSLCSLVIRCISFKPSELLNMVKHRTFVTDETIHQYSLCIWYQKTHNWISRRVSVS